MTKVIRNEKTKEFLDADGRWTGDLSNARQFDLFADVSQARKVYMLKNVELYYVYKNSQLSEWDVVIPLREN